MKSIVFMFGAGAEIAFSLPSGNEFMSETLFSDKSHVPKDLQDDSLKIKKLISDDFFKIRVICNLLMQSFNQSFLSGDEKCYEMLSKNEQDMISSMYKLNKSYVEENFGSLNVRFEKKGEFISKYKNDNDDLKDESEYYDKNSLLEILNLYLSNDEQIKKTQLQNTEEKYSKIFNDLTRNQIKINAIGLEKYFASINNPQKYGVYNYAKIVNLYWMIYFIITNACLRSLGETELNDDYVIDDAIQKNRLIWSDSVFPKMEKRVSDNYYSKLREIGSNKYSYSAITTNYTPYVNLMFDSNAKHDNQEEVAYLNGRLDMFENFKNLSVKSCLDDDEILYEYMRGSFPFLMAQSMIKPIIHPYQLKEYNKAISYLERADTLVILGYGLNEDDNHVNAILNNIEKN